ncbi:hypothetical protein GCM10022406_30010 [Hymenobacter algoricola]|uniref:Uncharacterized protein n=1 Tax=Hymenobacter algoricola TaxID=486267 RepID=A0ABP7NIF1_9BACT
MPAGRLGWPGKSKISNPAILGRLQAKVALFYLTAGFYQNKLLVASFSTSSSQPLIRHLSAYKPKPACLNPMVGGLDSSSGFATAHRVQ